MSASPFDPLQGLELPDLDAWRAEVARSLKGRPYDELSWSCDDGFALPPLLTRADAAALPHLPRVERGDLGRVGWAIRERIANADPDAAAAHARRALAQGADQIELCFDGHARTGCDPRPDASEPVGLAGWDGVAIYDASALAVVLDAVDLTRTTIALDAGPAALAALAFTLHHAAAAGLAPSDLHGELSYDPFDDEDPSRGPEQRLALAAALVQATGEHCPGLRALMLAGRPFHLAGAAPGQELGATMARAVCALRRLRERGVAPANTARSLAFRFDVSTEMLADAAKLRAARLVWAEIARAFEVPEAVARAVPFHAYTSTRCIAHRHDLRTNLLRTTVMAAAGVLGGCDALVVEPYEGDADRQDDHVLDLARQQQLLLRDEAFLGRVADPAAGSFALERLTHEIGAAAWQLLQAVEAQGGFDGGGELVAWSEIGEVGHQRAERFRRRQRVLIGVSRYVAPDLEGRRRGPLDRTALHSRLRAELAQRPAGDARDRTLHALASAGDAALVTAATDAAAAGASIGEIHAASHREPGEASEPDLLVLPAAGSDGREFEDRRDDEADSDGSFEATLWCAGDDPVTRARTDLARDQLRSCGIRLREPVDSAAGVLAGEGCDIVVLCAPDDRLGDLVATARRQLGDWPGALAAVARPEHAPRGVDALLHRGADVVATIDYLTLLAHSRALRASGEAVDPDLLTAVEQVRDQLQEDS